MSDMKKFCIVGAACRLPGAPNEASFRELLNNGAFAVGQCPTDRWYPDLLYHPDPRTPGRSYTFAGGFLPAPYDFDINVFGMSPREAEQVDPQQRILAEVVWEALENAWISPTALAGKEVGVYVGVSALDHANLFGGDPASIESHFMTGNTLSIVANRISYLFDLRGPSFVVDTACSSSLVAVDNALSDLRSGRVDTAIVAGVNMLMSPASFVGFSRAAMLSPTGACRPFSAQADGYVRSEGAVAFVLQREDVAATGSIRAFLSGSAVNSDGRTSGIALPGLEGQCSLLERAYSSSDITAEDLSFVEAHGTGTAVGDPIEAEAIGTILGKKRSKPLPIGSVKSNIGHLEPASGVAGMLKSVIAMEQRRLPATLHLDTINPDIPFEALNLLPASESIELDPGIIHCGVSSFGFGGTNAHIILSAPPVSLSSDEPALALDTLVLSAQCKASLAELSNETADRLSSGADPKKYAAAVARARPLLRQRAVIAVGKAEDMASDLRAFASGKQVAAVQTGSSLATRPEVCFVYNGNGSQWVGMGRTAYRTNKVFAHAFEETSQVFQSLGYSSLVDEMHADDLGERIGSAAIAQSLIFAIQVSITAALAEKGMRPDFVLGHSVGEIAAAYTAGILDLDQSARVLAARAKSQEVVRGSGGMATLAADRETVAQLIDETGLPDVGIAADNALASVTISGRNEAVAEILRVAKSRRIAGRKLEVEYPYHCELLDGIKESFLDELGSLSASPSQLAMISTVTGQRVQGQELDLPYWWQNIRSEVLFRQAVRTAAEEGANLFVEIGCRPILSSPVSKSIEDYGFAGRVIHSLAESDADELDPIGITVARAVANGFEISKKSLEGEVAVDRSIDLPSYPWQRQTYRYTPGPSAVDIHGTTPRHPLIGARISQGTPEWRTILDSDLVPYLSDHVLGGEVVVPGTALAEMALAVAREIWPSGPVSVEDFDIIQAMVIPAEGQREVSVRFSELPSTVEIYGRVRLSDDDWSLFARGRISKAEVGVAPPPEVQEGRIAHRNARALYNKANETGIEYGPAFRLFKSLRRDDDEIIEVALAQPSDNVGQFGRPQIVNPASLDASFHGLFDLLETTGSTRKAWLPIRFQRLTIWRDNATIAVATIEVKKSSDHLKTVSLWLFDTEGSVVGRLDKALLRPVVLSDKSQQNSFFHLSQVAAGRAACDEPLLMRIAQHFETSGIPSQSEGWLLLRAHMRAAAYRALLEYSDEMGVIQMETRFDQRLLSAKRSGFLASLFEELGEAGLVRDEDGKLILSPASNLPEPDTILATFAEDYPLWPTDLALSAHAAAKLASWLGNVDEAPVRPALVERSGSSSLRTMRACTALVDCLTELSSTSGGPLHLVLAHEHGESLLRALVEAAELTRFRISIAVPDANAAERMARRLPPSTDVEIIDLSSENVACADLVLALVPSPFAGPPANSIGMLAALLRPDGVFLAAELNHDNVAAFQLGPAGLSDLTSASRFADVLRSEPLLTEHLAFADEQHDLVLTASRRDGDVAKASQAPISIQVMHSAPHSAKICPCHSSVLRAEGLDCREIYSIFDSPSPRLSENTLYIVDATDDTESLARVLAELRDIIVELPARTEKSRLWIVAVLNELQGDATSAALRSFARVAMNEQPECDIRFIEISHRALGADIGEMLTKLIAQPGVERELSIVGDSWAVPRVSSGIPLSAHAQSINYASELSFPRPGILENFEWVTKERTAPGPFEIEVEVQSTGLNFRDVMLAMGLLNDDVLEEGLAGAVYGLECSGKVVAVGENVTRHKVGDNVFGFGTSSFSTHVIASQESFVAVPQGLSMEAAAGLAVPFSTAWYGLVELAKLSAGERVLIHGGAGGVGLAAIQIAAAEGAEVIATVSSPDKEAVARLYGAAHVYDSRSLNFVDQVRDVHGGVDVVLNSLSGDAMRGSIKCLRPRGRFIELGKRDYVDNSLLGLRPFRRNLSYFGVDLDQLLALDPAIVSEGLNEIADGFATGKFIPLPVTAYPGSEIGQAFRLMQSAGHIGKIVVTPPLNRPSFPLDTEQFLPGGGCQLVIGGTRGFGLSTAVWLAGRGAQKIVVASRSGSLDPDRLGEVESLRAKGIDFAVERVDVCDAQDVVELIDRVSSRYGPISGLFHTAVMLDDNLLRNLSEDSLAAVLRPKVRGAENLDRATRSQPIEHFVLYSSASAFVGNPGQSAYAAANGYMEGLARRRRREGLPALAVAWGAIADVGLLAGKVETLDSLGRVAGVTGMQSADALAHLGNMLALVDRMSDPVVTCADFVAGGALHALPLATSPAFRGMFGNRGIQDSAAGTRLADLVRDKPEAEAHRIVAALVVEEVAQILRLAAQEIDMDAPIDSLGMDSLMALELRMSIEAKHGLELPIMAISAAGSLRELAHRILRLVRQGDQSGSSDLAEVESALIAIHGGGDAANVTTTDTVSPVSKPGGGH